MCTVTYIPQLKEADFVLTSNRDERIYRPALSPKLYTKDKFTLCYPKDSKAGGSWIATNDKGRLCCLLNGGIISHEKQTFHTQSRGQILLGFASTDDDIHDYFNNKDLSSVEPFTLIAIDKGKNGEPFFIEFIWNGTDKHYKDLDVKTPYIWSSATLYSQKNRKLRKKWFNKFLENYAEERSVEKVMDFHSGTHTSDISNNLIMERNGGLRTVSITQVISKKNNFHMQYLDLIDSTENGLTL